MFELKGADFVCYLKDLLLPLDTSSWERLDYDSWRKPGIMVTLDIRMADYTRCDDDKEPVRRGGDASFVMCGNTNTFALVSRDPWYKMPWEQFENISNHDTCWRSAIDSFLGGIYFRWAEEINAELPEDRRKAPKDLSQHCFIGLRKHRMCTVTYKTDPDKEKNRHGDTYFKKLVNVEYND